MSGTDHGQRLEDPLDPVEVEEEGVAGRLHDGRPEPSATFRSEIRDHLIAVSPEDQAVGDGTKGPFIAGYLASGIILLLVTAAGVAGIGPFAS